LKPITREEIKARTNEELIELVRDRMKPYINSGKKDEEIIRKGSPKIEHIIFVWVLNFIIWKILRWF
jgi:SNF2 family DNA or RNA helicase